MKRLVCILMCCCMLLPLLPASGEGLSDVMCVYNCKEWVSLREDMSTSSKRLTKVYLGELVTNCKMAYDGFIQCDFGGKTGYIQSKYLKTTKYSSGESFPGNQMVVNVEEWTSMWESPDSGSKRIVKVPVGPESDYGQAMLANSITLTPGTITMDAAEDEEGRTWF